MSTLSGMSSGITSGSMTLTLNPAGKPAGRHHQWKLHAREPPGDSKRKRRGQLCRNAIVLREIDRNPWTAMRAQGGEPGGNRADRPLT